MLRARNPSGVEYERVRYSPSNEDARRTDTIRLSGAATTFAAGDSYHQLAHELHASRQTPGTVTIMCMAFKEVPQLAVCSQPGMDWVSGRSHPASPEEVEQITATALDQFSNTSVDARVARFRVKG